MQSYNNYQEDGRAKSVPVYPVVLFIVAFLYLLGVMTWQIWKDHDYHLSFTSSAIKNRVVLFHDFFKAQLEPLDRLLTNEHIQPVNDQTELDAFFLKTSQISPLVIGVLTIDKDARVLAQAGVPLSKASTNTLALQFQRDRKMPVSGLRILNDNQGYLFHRRNNNQGYLLVVFSLDWFVSHLKQSNVPLTIFELTDTTSERALWIDGDSTAAEDDRKHVWSVRLMGSELELSGYVNKAAMVDYYRSTLTPSALVAFFYLFGGISLIWYLTTARKQNRNLQQQNRELSLRSDLILSSISDAVLVLGHDQKVHYANHAFYSLLKLDPKKDLITGLKEHGDWPVVEKLVQWTDQLLDHQSPKIDSLLSIDSLAVSRFVEPTHQALSLEDSSKVVVWVLKDVTQQQRMYEQLLTSQNHYQSTFEIGRASCRERVYAPV